MNSQVRGLLSSQSQYSDRSTVSTHPALWCRTQKLHSD